MGNVHAAEGVPAPPLGSVPAPTPPGQQAGQSTQAPPPPQPSEPESDHPGTFEDLHQRCKGVFPMPFEGAKLLINKGLSNHFQISHTLTMSSIMPSGYRFGATYVGSTQYGPMEAFPVVIGDIDPSGNLNANIIHQFSSNTRTKLVSQIQGGKWAATQFSGDYKGEDFTASLTLGNIDVLNESGVVVGQYLQNITKNLALGTEMLYQYGPNVPGGEMAMLTFAGRYTTPQWQISGNVVPAAGGLHTCYYHKINDTAQVGVELEGSLRTQECTTSIGYQIDMPSANVVFRGQLDTNWCIGAVLEKKLMPLPFTLALSGMANHVKGQYRFGMGLIVG
ncbi:unnamed protein product [Owenia fusiformis]|uniref:Uncharacterized protein n=1 Tax=Owenia fusiformis TaxID=6347 RepID=A0A8J1TUM4_OWEFU|nr:unnamed protein product [Owenia fusiformis]